jgi:hypothetical protein
MNIELLQFYYSEVDGLLVVFQCLIGYSTADSRDF